MSDAPQYVLGIDAGATKTFCALATVEGEVLALGVGGCGNFQSNGVAGARTQIGASVDDAIAKAGVSRETISVAYYAVAGADRPADFETIERLVAEINPAARMFVENDTVAAIRAGTADGVGIGLIAGTGTNAIGFNRRGERLRVGGMGRLLQDFGCAQDLVEAAIGAAQAGYDGRGEPTMLFDMFCGRLGIRELEDVAEFFYYDSYRPLDLARYAPLVFEAANRGDAVALGILRRAGHTIAKAANVIRGRLFSPDEEVTVVLGGSVLQKGENPAVVETIRADMLARFPKTNFVKLGCEPVAGAALLALDRHWGRPRDDLRERVVATGARAREAAGAGRGGEDA